MSFSVSAQELLAHVKRLPVLPRAALDLREALRDDEVPMARLLQIVGSDPALTMAALRLANSPFYGASGRVATLRDALQVLGTQTLACAVMTAAVMGCFEPADCPAFDLQGNWRHAVATALCAQALARPRGLDGELAYVAGLLHDIGRLALACHCPQAYSATRAWSNRHNLPPIVAERTLMGTDHALAGGLVATHWGLPPLIAEAVRLHHEPPAGPAASEIGLLLDVLHLADAITHALDLSHEPDEMVPPVSPAAWQRLGLGSDELQAVFAEVEQRMAGIAGADPG